MARQHGILLDRQDEVAIVLTPDGQFLRLPRPEASWKVGEEVSFAWPAPDASLPVWRRVSRPAWVGVAVAAALALFVVVRGPAGLGPQTRPAPGPGVGVQTGPGLTQDRVPVNNLVAYVTVDINPSLELAVDAQGKVSAVNPLNADAQGLLRGVSMVGMTVGDAVTRITQLAVDQGYLQSRRTNAVLISTVPMVSRLPAGLDQTLQEKTLEAAAQKALRPKRLQASVVAIMASPGMRKKAQDLGLSTGKLAVLVEANREGYKIGLAEIKSHRIAEVLERAGLNAGKVLPKLKGENLEEVLNNMQDRLKEQGIYIQPGVQPGDGQPGGGQGPENSKDRAKEKDNEKDNVKNQDKEKEEEKEKDEGQERDQKDKEQSLRDGGVMQSGVLPGRPLGGGDGRSWWSGWVKAGD